MILSLTWLLLSGHPAFAVAPILFLTSWNFVAPYMMGTVATLETSGRAVALNMTLQYIGFATGPLLAGIITARIYFNASLVFGVIAFILCLVLFLSAIAFGATRARLGGAMTQD